ncbi:putative dehydrogenase [Microbacterium sp. AK009]|uniref:Gfo/Idh/MocA family protein n=1 Tax=Microbacterium sp. AK009 TaxID=2723068 RepID=UPI0015C93E8B|nr:Gfo/Idh/MocA family oxidoreductase [Microbacterium sp. AK009]NYF16628.1 putative dehydrogenase [Microbacterium sp. AK009]
MPDEAKAKVGVIGLGVYGALHARTYAAMDGAELTGVCDLRPDRSRDMAAELGCNGYTDVQQMLATCDLDAVSIALPDHLHADAAITAARAGKHVLVEKPLATTVDECLQVIAAAEESGVFLMTDFSQRWSPVMQLARKAVTEGDLGDVQLGYYRANDTIYVPTKMLSWGAQSTVAWFLASHCLDNLMWLFDARDAYAGGAGDCIRRVRTVARQSVLAARGLATPDFYLTTLEWESGMVTTLENCWILPESSPSVFDMKVQLIGSRGTFHIDGSHSGVVEQWAEKTSYLDPFAYLEVFGEPVGFATSSIRHFVSSVAKGVPPSVDGFDGLAVTRLILAMEKSIAVQAPVDIRNNPFRP